jgi:hypothetical protein
MPAPGSGVWISPPGRALPACGSHPSHALTVFPDGGLGPAISVRDWGGPHPVPSVGVGVPVSGTLPWVMAGDGCCGREASREDGGRFGRATPTYQGRGVAALIMEEWAFAYAGGAAKDFFRMF